MNRKHISLMISLGALSLMAVTYTQCGRSAHLYGSSKEEINALQGPIFTFPEPNPGTDIEGPGTDDPDNNPGTNNPSDDKDSYIPANPYKTDPEPFKWVTSCNELDAPAGADKDAYIQKVKGETDVVPGVSPYADIKTSREFELAVVKKIVEDRIKEIKAGKNLPLLIPVEFTFSTGDKHDKISYMAYRRSILRNDTDGVSYLPTAKHTYVVEHENARSHFIDGRFKYYSFVEVKSIAPKGDAVFADFVKGQPFSDKWAAYNMHLLGGGLSGIQGYVDHYDAKKELPVGRLFLADIRDDILPISKAIGSMHADTGSKGRNSEVTRRLKDIFNMKNIFQNSELLTHAFAVDRTQNIKGFSASYTGYAGMPQLIHKMNCDVGSSSVISAQYTPIVMDLGEPYIRTSSENWGTFFNLANAQVVRDGEALPAEGENTFTHKTAWIGGYLRKVPNPVIEQVVDKSTVVPFKEVWQRVAEDGFLVLPPAEEKALTAANLFGASFVNPDKPEEKYADGFKALQDFSGTSGACVQTMAKVTYQGEPSEEVLNARYEEIKQRYLGPWNEKFYKLKVWVDANRDGVAQKTELKGLIESGVMAINTCLISLDSSEETDRFGNNTKLRSAFLYDKSLVSGAEASEDEIKSILKTLALGKKPSGDSGNFRLMVDIFFKARPFHFLERSLQYRSNKDKKKFQVKIGDNIYDEDSSDVPQEFR